MATNSSRILLILLLIFTASVTSGQKNKLITIKTNSAGAAIFVNSELKGVGSKVTFRTSSEHFNIRIFQNMYKWNSPYYLQNIKTANYKNEIVLNFYFKNYVLNTIPQDAAVFKNDSLLGFTPLNFAALHSVKLKITKKGYKSRNIILNPGKPITSVKLERIGIEKKAPYFESSEFPYLIAAGIILSGVAAYFKISADRRYDEYLNNPTSRKLALVNRYDLISGISLGMFELDIGYLIYKILSEQ